MMTGVENKTDNKRIKAQTRFVVTREFCGTQTMQEAFEQLIERQACGQFEEWLGRKAG